MLFSFWDGPTTWMERLSVASARAIGQQITVFTYGDQKALARELNCEVRDAASVLDAKGHPEKCIPHFSDHFRVEGLAQGLGTWVDLDIIHVRPLPAGEYIFAWQNDSRIGNSVLRMPADGELVKRYLLLCRERPLRRIITPWMPWYTRVARVFRLGLPFLTGATLPPAKYGPPALTHFVRVCGLERHTLPSRVIYPLPITAKAVARVYEPGYLEALITRDTACVHLWRSTFSGCNGLAEPTVGWLADRYRTLLPQPETRVA